jgi:hypothetical protein
MKTGPRFAGNIYALRLKRRNPMFRLKVKMISRYSSMVGKLEQGLIYDLPRDYARMLIAGGHAKLMPEPKKSEAVPEAKKTKEKAPKKSLDEALKEKRTENQNFIRKEIIPEIKKELRRTGK